MTQNPNSTTHVHRASVASFLLRIGLVLLISTSSFFLTGCGGEKPTDVVNESYEAKFYQPVKITKIAPDGTPTVLRKAYYTVDKDRDFQLEEDSSIWVSYRKLEDLRRPIGRGQVWVKYGRSLDYKLKPTGVTQTKDGPFKIGDQADLWIGFTTRTLRNGEVYTEITSAEIRPWSNTPEPKEVFQFN
jgi:hypothetical protein